MSCYSNALLSQHRIEIVKRNEHIRCQAMVSGCIEDTRVWYAWERICDSRTRSPPHMKQRSRKLEEEVFRYDVASPGCVEKGWQDGFRVEDDAIPRGFYIDMGKGSRFLSCLEFLGNKVSGSQGRILPLLELLGYSVFSADIDFLNVSM